MGSMIEGFFNSLRFNFLSFLFSLYNVTCVIKNGKRCEVSNLVIGISLKVSLSKICHLLERTKVARSSIYLNKFCSGSQYRHFYYRHLLFISN